MNDRPEPRDRRRSRREDRPRRRRTVLWVLLVLLAVLIFAAAWIGIRGLLAKNALDEAVPAATTLPAQLVSGDRAAAEATLETFTDRASDAARLTSDPIWRVAELVPVLGDNLTAVREAAAIVDDVAQEGIAPLVTLTETVTPADLVPVDGAVQLQPLIDAQPALTAADTAMTDAAARALAIDTQHVLPFVANAVERLQSTVTEAATAADALERAAALLPAMLSAEGGRDYVLMFQNPAELRAGGGLAGAFALLNATDGRIELTQQVTASEFGRFDEPVLQLPPETLGLYGEITARYMGNVTMTPQFELSGALTQAMWRERFGIDIDGVISVDPVALSYILRATGPLTLPTGDVITSENAVQLLLTDVYTRYPNNRQQDLFFASAAQSVFEAATSGGLDAAALVGALAQAGEERRILLWSADGAEQERLSETTLAGLLPQSDETTTRFGLYLNDATGAKMGTYLDTKVAVGQATCREDGRPEYAIEVTFTNTAPSDAATTLPGAITGPGTYGVPKGNIGVIANVYGAEGMQPLGLFRDGEAIPHHSTTDSGHPVAALEIELTPGESTTFTARFLGETRFGGEIAIDMTPEVSANVLRGLAISCIYA